MHSFTTILTLAAFAMPSYAFTNGTLVPSYICNPQNDGLPKSFGQLLQYTQKKVTTLAFNNNRGNNLNNVPQTQQTGTTPAVSAEPNSAYILASFHDSLNQVYPINQSVTPSINGGGNTIKAGTTNQLTFTAANGQQLKGLLVYSRDANGNPTGSFKDNGNIFTAFAGCGSDATTGNTNGIIQTTGVSATASYSNIVYNAPACIQGNQLLIKGLSVSAGGFGVWNKTFTVTGSTCSGTAGTTGTTGTTGTGKTGNTGATTGTTGTTNSTNNTATTGTGAGAAAAGAGSSKGAGAGGQKSSNNGADPDCDKNKGKGKGRMLARLFKA